MRIFLAPMEGVVDFHLRKLYATVGGIDACVTEFIRINEHVLPQKVFTKTCPELLRDNRRQYIDSRIYSTLPIRVQLLGSDPELLALNAKKAAKLGASGIDLNFGCPAKTVNKNRGGACLLDETELLYSIVRSVRDAVPASIPVTAKIRLGYNDRDSYLINAHTIERAGANELFVHARSKADGYNPPAYWHLINDIRNALHIPVIANGEIWTLDDFKRCKDQSGCTDIMLGRGLLANPGLAREIKNYSANTPSFNSHSLNTCSMNSNSTAAKNNTIKSEHAELRWRDVAHLLLLFFEDTCQAYPAKYLGNRVKQWLHYLKQHFEPADLLFEEIKRSKDERFIRASIERQLVNS